MAFGYTTGFNGFQPPQTGFGTAPTLFAAHAAEPRAGPHSGPQAGLFESSPSYFYSKQSFHQESFLNTPLLFLIVSGAVKTVNIENYHFANLFCENLLTDYQNGDIIRVKSAKR